VKTFIYHLVPVRQDMLRDGPDPDEALIISEHFRYLKQLCDDGVVLTAGRTDTVDEHTFGVVILEAESESIARDIMRKDPATLHGIMHASLYPFRLALWSDTGPSGVE